ncbi:hypothetical protein JSY36_06960 [Bacillus sp. H-16]|uniref:DUF6544 family protein n=1 Tax=Alteribacter salitolerans TaxID=2912333 RepID=UPI001962FFCA|nr:DUF6544 family protein [Alteribacter salitolerans]MBM7095486.1 hypothetical protein [Alteribacter salitolerans]
MLEQILSDIVVSFIVVAVLFLGVLLISNWVFLNRFREDVLYLKKGQDEEGEKKAEELPKALVTYLSKVNIASQMDLKQAFITYEGFHRVKQKGPLVPVKGEQFFLTDRPAYMWMGFSKLNPVIRMSSLEKLKPEEGSSFTRLWSVFPVNKASGPQVIKNHRFRYAAEMAWFPQSFVHNNSLIWTESGEREVKGEFHGVEPLSYTLTFNEEGLIEQVQAEERVRDGQKERWTVHYSNYKANQDNVLVPYRVDTFWNTANGDVHDSRIFLKTVHYE